eukprot:Rhum_TRINITY_DN15088_c0_g1::Rhum_TRINITY_DN15088_c0_g1_i1::g.137043::m.137043
MQLLLLATIAASGLAAADTCAAQTGGHTTPILCHAGLEKKAGYDAISCDYETADGENDCQRECCDTLCSHTAFSCGAGKQKKATASAVRCPASGCTATLCCDSVATTELGRRELQHHTLEWCAEDADCRRHGDFLATCASGSCACSASFEHAPGVALCFAKTVPLYFALRFAPGTPGDVCDKSGPGAVNGTVAAAIVSLVEAVTTGKVSDAAVHCVEDGVPRVEALLRVNVRAAQYALYYATDATSATTDAANKASMTLRIQSDRTFLSKILGEKVESLVSDEAQNRALVKDCAASVVNAKYTKALPNGECAVLSCDAGKTKSVNAVNGPCFERAPGAAAPACNVDGDCSWDTTLPLCVAHACVADQRFHKLKAAAPRALTRHWCHVDADCSATGDSSAVCDKNPGLGNWCKCASPFRYPAPYLPVCVAATAPATLPFGFGIVFPAGMQCPPTEAQTAAVRDLVRGVFGHAADSFHSVCTQFKGVSFIGTAEVDLALAVELSASTDVQLLRTKFVTELRRGQRVAAAQATYTGLGQAEPTSVTAGTVVECPATGASKTATDINGRCYVLECSTGYVLRDVAGTTSCVRPGFDDTPVPAVPTTVVAGGDDDDGLTAAEKAGIGIGVVAAVLLLVGGIFAYNVYSSQKKEEADKQAAASEPENAHAKAVEEA